MIIVTGSAGFIGSCFVSKLNNKGIKDIVLVDDFSSPEKNRNIANKIYSEKIDRKHFFPWLTVNHKQIDFIFHIGARTDTTEFNTAIFDELNLNYSKSVWTACSDYSIPLIYASSAATYGDGSLGYNDDHALIPQLRPLNPYGISKNEFDKWVLEQPQSPPSWFGLKFFNVYGPNEYHKGRMASVVFHAFRQVTSGNIRANGERQKADSISLFRSHNPGYKDGEQLRDFIYVKDVADVLYFLMEHKSDSGIYNLGTGRARTFLSLANAVFTSLNKPSRIEFIETPADIRDKYQYFTEANMKKLFSIGYSRPFHSLEEGIEEYVQGYLLDRNYF
jgi:ADP-L-glycero-D-manno-heptose 6-epimerase